ncbi:MAG: hypothetical protein P8H03_09135 [Emcibacteraceae bacterium]|nr:hypothetical protein [Emcibacteraceae bacterium]
MKENNKSKFIVTGFVVFVLATYGGSYFYTKDKNETLLSSPRLVLLVGSEDGINNEFAPLEIQDRRDKIRSLAQLGLIQTVSQQDYDAGETDIAKSYEKLISNGEYAAADCLEYSQLIKRTMERNAKTALKTSWIFSACGLFP